MRFRDFEDTWLTVNCVDCELVQKRFVLRFGILWYFSGMICSLFAMGCLLGQIKEPQKCGDMEKNLQMLDVCYVHAVF